MALQHELHFSDPEAFCVPLAEDTYEKKNLLGCLFPPSLPPSLPLSLGIPRTVTLTDPPCACLHVYHHKPAYIRAVYSAHISFFATLFIHLSPLCLGGSVHAKSCFFLHR